MGKAKRHSAQGPHFAQLLVALAVVWAPWTADRCQAFAADPITEEGIESLLAEADGALQSGRCGQAFSGYLVCLDMARTIESPQTLTADKRAEDVWRKVADLPEPTLDDIEGSLPAWESLQTPRAKAWEARFLDARRRRFAASGDTVRAHAAAEAARKMAWSLIQEHPADLVVRKAIQLYRDTSEAVGQQDACTRALADYASGLPSCLAKFCITYWAVQDAQKAGQFDAHEEGCRQLLQIHETGGLGDALEDPFADPLDKLFIDYHVAYACFVLGDMAKTLDYCEYTLGEYAQARDTAGKRHGALIKMAMLRAMAIAGLAPREPVKGIDAYDEFLGQYPDSGDAPMAWVCKALLYEQMGDIPKAAECYETAMTEFPDTPSGREACERRALLLRQ